MLEIERKFLLRRIPELKFDSLQFIKQLYIWNNHMKEFERYRKVTSDFGINYFYTFKTRISHGIQEEFEHEIDKKEFDKVLKSKKYDKIITKKRMIFKDGEITWEIDDFENVKLIVAEVELPKETYRLKIPKQIKNEMIIEVTGMTEFFNDNLAVSKKNGRS